MTVISKANQCITIVSTVAQWAPAGVSIFRTVLFLTRDNAIPRMLWRHDQFLHKYFIHPFTFTSLFTPGVRCFASITKPVYRRKTQYVNSVCWGHFFQKKSKLCHEIYQIKMADSGGKSFNTIEKTQKEDRLWTNLRKAETDYNCGFWKLVILMSFPQSSFNSEKKNGKAGFAIRLFIREETSPGCGGGEGGREVEI